MHTRRLGALLVALALLAAACGGAREDASSEGGAASEGGGGSEATCGEPSTGVSDDAVTLGGIYPLSGPASAYGAVPAGLQAYIEYTNEEQGGAPGAFEGRTIEYVLEDDSYSPPNSVEAARKLVERDQVFAIVQSRAPRRAPRSGTTSTSRRSRRSWRPARPCSASTSQGTRGRSGGSPTTCPRRGGLRAVPAGQPARGQGCGAVPERRLRDGLPRRLQGGHRGQRRGHAALPGEARAVRPRRRSDGLVPRLRLGGRRLAVQGDGADRVPDARVVHRGVPQPRRRDGRPVPARRRDDDDGEADGFPLEAMAVGSLEGEQWVLEGDVVNTRDVFGPVDAAAEESSSE